MKFAELIRSFFFEDERSSKLSKNILFTFLVKGYAMGIQFALVPITLSYLDKFNYGIWIVLSAILEWFSYFDIGVGHGLRNKLSEALAHNKYELAKIFTSTGYALITIIFIGFIFIFILVNPLIDWATILNINYSDISHLNELVLMVFCFFCIRFILSLITPVIYAKQDPAINSFMGPLASTISLGAIIMLSKWVTGSLFWIALIFSAAPLLIMGIFTIVLFLKRYRDIIPEIKYVNFSYSKDLFGLGINFFVIHVSMLVLFSSANLIITQLFGPSEVTVYNIGYRYFTIGILINGMITLPYWSSFTEAFEKREIDWVKKSIRKLNYISYLLIAGVIVSFFLSDILIFWWVGGDIKVSLPLKSALTIHVVILLLAAPYNIFINGVSKVRLQLFMAILSIVVTIPLALFFCNVLHLGTSGVVFAMICSTLPGGILWRIQYQKIITNTARGIWNR